MDYRKFLGKKETVVLPVFDPERRTLNAPSRRLRLLPAAQPLTRGWWRFGIEGRGARPEAPCDAPPMEALPAVRGHLLLFSDRPGEAHLVREGAVAEPLHLMPEEDPPLFSPCLARRWHGGELIFAGLEFETGPEEAARLALEEGRSLAQERGVPATLRAAFGFALARVVSRAAQVPLSPLEVRGRVLAIAEEGRPAAEALLRHLIEERERAARAAQQAAEEARRRQVVQPAVRPVAPAPAPAPVPAPVPSPGRGRGPAPRRPTGREEPNEIQRAEAALEAAGAEPLGVRRLGDGLLEVTYRFLGERFVTVVEAATLQVVDAGICLDGADRMVTLESLPSVIQEAVLNDELVITWRWRRPQEARR
jgi:hypothetical protein